jgi:hypothetical protein
MSRKVLALGKRGSGAPIVRAATLYQNGFSFLGIDLAGRAVPAGVRLAWHAKLLETAAFVAGREQRGEAGEQRE